MPALYDLALQPPAVSHLTGYSNIEDVSNNPKLNECLYDDGYISNSSLLDYYNSRNYFHLNSVQCDNVNDIVNITNGRVNDYLSRYIGNLLPHNKMNMTTSLRNSVLFTSGDAQCIALHLDEIHQSANVNVSGVTFKDPIIDQINDIVI